MSTLLIGPKYFSEGASNKIKVYEGDKVKFQVDGLENLYSPGSKLLQRFATDIDTVEVGFCDISDLNFLQHLPNIKRIWILTSYVRDINGLRYALRLRSLAIERPTCRMDVLGEVTNLEEIHLDTWRPGAASVFGLAKLRTVGFGRYPYKDLDPMRRWTQLNELGLAYGDLENLNGIPHGVTILELAQLRKLHHINHIRNAHGIERLIIQGCNNLTSLAGIEACSALKTLSIFNSRGPVENLQPIRGLSSLTYLALTDFVGILKPDETILDDMQQLEMLIISKKLGIPAERLRRMLPTTEIRVVR